MYSEEKIKNFEEKFRKIMSPREWHTMSHNKTFGMLLDESLHIMKAFKKYINQLSDIIQNTKSISGLQKEVHKNAIEKGFYDEELKLLKNNTGRDFELIKSLMIERRLLLMHSELSESLEGLRHGIDYDKKGGLTEELADAVIRIMDTAEFLKIDLEKAIIKKHEYNKKREYKHGKKF